MKDKKVGRQEKKKSGGTEWKTSGWKPSLGKGRPEVVRVEELSALEGIGYGGKVVKEVTVVTGEGKVKWVRFEGRRLSSKETLEVQCLLRGALPPVIPARDGEPERYDMRDPDYLRQSEVNRRKARSLACWSGFPVVREAWAAEERGAAERGSVERGALDAKGIVEWMEGKGFEEDLLDQLFGALTERRVFEGHVGFS